MFFGGGIVMILFWVGLIALAVWLGRWLFKKARTGGYAREVAGVVMEKKGKGWGGRTGHWPDAIAAEMFDPSSSHAYLCGPPVTVDAAVARLRSMGVEDSRIFFDKFLDASSMPGGRP